MKHCDKQIKTEYLGDLPIDNLETLPDYLLTERDTEEPETGNVVRQITRTPAGKLFPTANLDNIFALESNNPAIVVPENQVRACYVADTGSAIQMDYAGSGHEAMFLAVGQTATLTLCQNCGVVNIPNGHDYIIGAEYYVGPDGEPVTGIVGGQKLFVPVSRTKLLINM